MTVFQKSKWIWDTQAVGEDTYCEFVQKIPYEGGRYACKLSCDGDYTLFINGKFVETNQYPDYEHYKIYDEIDITNYLQIGENIVAILVWHFGMVTQKSIVAQAGLIFEITKDDQVVCASGENTLVRMSKAYESGRKHVITVQLGYGFAYNSTKEDGWIDGTGEDFHSASVVEKRCVFYPRANKKMVLLDKKSASVVSNENNTRFVIDLGEETVGIPRLDFESGCAQKMVVSWGESLRDGRVERIIGARDFSFDYFAKPGKNEYVNYMLRLGCRYLEVECESPIVLEYAGVIPQVYPTVEKKAVLQDSFDQEIYDLCIKTMRLCMMERYVDCPWREQCLYAFDSRNQMLFGYYAYEDGNAEYAKSNLLLIAQDRREDGLLSICFPCSKDMTIPSFSLHYILAVKEYVAYTGDNSIIPIVYDKLSSLLSVFANTVQGGLACRFKEKAHWNFYDWSPHSEGGIYVVDEPIPDILINSLFVLALDAFAYLCERGNQTNPYLGLADTVRGRAYEKFFMHEEKLFSTTGEGNDCTELGNALALLAKIPCDGNEKAIAQSIADKRLAPCSLSNKIFKFIALLDLDEESYKQSVLEEIRADFRFMIEKGATSVWETLKGKADQAGAGSLCHAWGCVPVYIFNRLGMIER